MQLHLIRHGQTDWNEERRVQGQSESRLTDLGIQQAKELGERIQHLHFDHVICSSSVRTRQTASHVFAPDINQIDYLDSLREIHLGPWEGHLYDDIAARDPESFEHFWQAPHLFDVDGAETFFQLQERAIATVQELLTIFQQKQVAIISHGALIKTILCHIENRPMSELWTPPHMHNCAHSIIEFNSGGIGRIIQYADQSVGNMGSKLGSE